ncbi:DUF4159 domain-containing protein [Rhizobium sp. EC-SD404]|uniref:DUF4159 domain-containing protein n=1 Tax=Rhizobium sp. EC-SD404 TaxID=2038389 RepID=UPI001250E28E|nr:DUF4159 domain-containing protein [Rhizobium sp. EC-SD404]VVT10676.1 RNA-binding protein [Rhizobium sp. EC-SD404]
MLGLPLAFSAPLVLFGLLALPVIWWLLRLTPPRPQAEIFPPLRILARVMKREETPSKSPWWLTLLRLAIAGFIILALADPILNPRENSISTGGPLVIVMDNGWATAADWDDRVSAASRLITDAEESEIPVSLVFTADATHDANPRSAAQALERLQAASALPQHGDRARTLAAVADTLGGTAPGTLAILSDGVTSDTEETDRLSAQLEAIGAASVLLFEDGPDAVALVDAENGADAFVVEAQRPVAAGAVSYPFNAHDIQGRAIAEGSIDFADGETAGTGSITAPFELRNDFARFAMPGIRSAGAAYLLDDSFRRRRVALLSGASADLAQPLLAPLYYIERALEPFADIVRPRDPELSVAIPELIATNPSVIVMADIGTLPDDVYGPLTEWVEDGGLLLRFAGPRLAGADENDPLIPVTLRQGERALGGALSWTEPQNLAPYPDQGPFAGMPPPENIVVNRQVLAQPSPELSANTWASLEDGTPLVTTRQIGEGRTVLFHVTAEATWSSLPISGDFVEMLRRTVMLSSAGGQPDGGSAGEPASLPPYRLLDAAGQLVAPSGEARPLVLSNEVPTVSPENPPGLYGTEDGFIALNLMDGRDALQPVAWPDVISATRMGYGTDNAVSLRPHLFTAAMILLLLDSAIVLFMAGFARRLRMGSPALGRSAAGIAAILAVSLTMTPEASAQTDDTRAGDDIILEQLNTTRIGYVLTGEDDVDNVSERGLAGLAEFLAYRTSLEPGAPAGLDIETDQLSFFPLIYWPVSATAPMPSAQAISRIDAYMKAGGTVLFDTRDQFSGLGNAASPETDRLRAILADLDIPPLEPVPEDHVLTKAFYLLPDFPGRYRGGEMWIEQLPQAGETRTMTSADGVTSVIITGNDLAGAWAIDGNGVPIYPTVPADPAQREFAYRTGVNIMMYMLTGNYKTDQVHVPALLERLGQ